MAKIEKLDDHRRGDKLAAHLALTAVQSPGDTSACLSAEQLADVASGCCSAEERKAALSHFSNCQQCYKAWLAVSLSLAAVESDLKPRKKSRKYTRIFSYFGSAFAIAASVVLFLNLRDLPITQEVEPVSVNRVSTLLQVEPDQDQQSMLQQEEPVGSVGSATTSTASSPSPSSPLKKHEARAKVQMKVDSSDDRGSAVKERARRVSSEAEMTLPSPSVSEDVADAVQHVELSTVTEWLADVEDVCRDLDEKGSDQRWARIKEQGKTIDGLEPQEKLAEILKIIEEGELVERGEQCRRILQLLAEESNKE